MNKVVLMARQEATLKDLQPDEKGLLSLFRHFPSDFKSIGN